MRRSLPFLCCIFIFANSIQAAPSLTIYTYDSMLAKGGLGEKIFPLFEKRYSCKIRALASGDAGQILNRLQLDKSRGKSPAQVLLGIDQNLWQRVRADADLWTDWQPKRYQELRKEVKIGNGFLAFDYGIFAFMANEKLLQKSHLKAPTRLNDLLSSDWKRRLLLEDPRVSTPGLAFLLYTQKLKGLDFWKRLKGQWLTLAPSWDQAYGLFLKGEAPLVWSYTTSEAYHRAHGETQYKALEFEDGYPYEVEGAAILKTADNKDLARKFLDFLVSDEVQSAIPETNWMLPSVAGARLPKSFQNILKVKKLVNVEASAAEVKKSLSDWNRIVESSP